jgi:hypothetical protein
MGFQKLFSGLCKAFQAFCNAFKGLGRDIYSSLISITNVLKAPGSFGS